MDQPSYNWKEKEKKRQKFRQHVHVHVAKAGVVSHLCVCVFVYSKTFVEWKYQTGMYYRPDVPRAHGIYQQTTNTFAHAIPCVQQW